MVSIRATCGEGLTRSKNYPNPCGSQQGVSEPGLTWRPAGRITLAETRGHPVSQSVLNLGAFPWDSESTKECECLAGDGNLETKSTGPEYPI